MSKSPLNNIIGLTALATAVLAPWSCGSASAGTVYTEPVKVVADTIVRTDTVVVTKIVKRTEVIRIIDEVLYENTLPAAGSKTAPPAPPAPQLPQSPATPLTEPGMEMLVADTPEETASPFREIPLVQGDMELSESSQAPQTSIPSDAMPVIARKAEAETQHRTNERVTFRGDTIDMVLRDRNWGRYDRGLLNYLFIPKGIWTIGATASYGEFSTKDLEILDLISDVDFSGHLFSIRPYFSYFIGNNRSVGMRLGYTSGKADIGSFNLDIDEDMSFSLHDISYRSETYTAAVTYRQYFGLSRKGRFGIYNEVELAFSSGNSDFVRPYGGNLKTTHTNSAEAALNFSPGVSIFIMEPVSFNLSFGVFGVKLRNEKQTVDGERLGNRFTSGANFRFNVFNLSFGIAVHL